MLYCLKHKLESIGQLISTVYMEVQWIALLSHNHGCNSLVV